MQGTKFKVLLIFSQINKTHFKFDISLINKINAMDHPYCEFKCLVDPARKDLELLLQNNEYLCIIPCAHFTLMKTDNYKYQLNNYVVSQLLQNLALEFWGCTYISTLILHEKAICSQMSLGMPVPQLVTKYNYKLECKSFKTCGRQFPFTLQPVYTNNCLAIESYSANSVYEACSKIACLFENEQDIEEIYLYEDIPVHKKIIVTLLGNPPLSLALIYEYNKDMSEGKPIRDSKKYTKLLTNSYQLFNEYNFRDFGQFVYAYDNKYEKYYLIDINSENCLDSTVIVAFQQYYALDISGILNTMLIIYLSRLVQTNTIVELVKSIADILPKEISETLIPFSIKQNLQLNYNYKTVCTELKGRFLCADERNRNDFMKYINNCLKNIPDIKNPNDIYLGNRDKDYFFLEQFEAIPDGPQDVQNVLNISTQILNGQMRWHAPSMLYNVNPPVMFNAVAATAIAKLYNPNAITRRTSSGFTKMEEQIVRQLARLLEWDEKETAGVFTPGGKYCLTYAVKCGLNRCNPQSQEVPVVITSEINHFSIESICEHLGLGGRCIRIPLTQEGIIDLNIFKQTLTECFAKKVPIACIILSGGNTTHCNVEDVKQGKDILYKLINQLNIDYTPYIYYDLVICWPWLFFKYYDFNVNKLNINTAVLSKITITVKKILYSKLADGVGIDFHKGGFAPYTSSIFLSQSSNELYSIFNETINGNSIEPHRYTFGNSRGTSDILVTWNILQSVGIEGFQSYIANMLTVAYIFTNGLPDYGFTVLEKKNTYGFATIIWSPCPKTMLSYDEFIESSEEIIIANNKYLYALSEYWITNKGCNYHARFIPNYTTISNSRKIAIISILPMTLNINEEQTKIIVNELGQLKKQFDQRYLSQMNLSIGKMPESVEK